MEPLVASMTSIGWFRTESAELYQCPHQPMESDTSTGVIKLHSGCNYEQALTGLEGFSKIWVLFLFHDAGHWKPMVHPPRGQQKMGCLATRTPHRPNSIGMSALNLIEIKGRNLWVGHHDIIDKTPVLDIKPYLPSADAFPDEKGGWTDAVGEPIASEIHFSEQARAQLDWLKAQGLDLWSLAEVTLKYYPKPQKRKRTKWVDASSCELACKTWRLRYRWVEQGAHRVVHVDMVSTGYPPEVLDGRVPSRWEDLELHNAFLKQFC